MVKPEGVSDLHWEQLIFAQKSITFEICLAGGGLGEDASLYKLLMEDRRASTG